MRQKFVQVSTVGQAYDECPWAAVCVRVCSGYMCFESLADFEVWSRQK